MFSVYYKPCTDHELGYDVESEFGVKDLLRVFVGRKSGLNGRLSCTNDFTNDFKLSCEMT